MKCSTSSNVFLQQAIRLSQCKLYDVLHLSVKMNVIDITIKMFAILAVLSLL